MSETKTVDGKTNNTGQPYVKDKRQKPQWKSDPTEMKYNNKNYCSSHRYDTSDPYTSETFTRTNAGHMKKATRGNPMGDLKTTMDVYVKRMKERRGR